MTIKYQILRDETGKFGIEDMQGGLVYESQFAYNQARRLAKALNTDDSLTWEQVADYVEGRTNEFPVAPKPLQRKSRKGVAITPSQGGRTESIYQRLTPEAKQKLDKILKVLNKTKADWLNDTINEQYEKLV